MLDGGCYLWASDFTVKWENMNPAHKTDWLIFLDRLRIDEEPNTNTTPILEAITEKGLCPVTVVLYRDSGTRPESGFVKYEKYTRWCFYAGKGDRPTYTADTIPDDHQTKKHYLAPLYTAYSPQLEAVPEDRRHLSKRVRSSKKAFLFEHLNDAWRFLLNRL